MGAAEALGGAVHDRFEHAVGIFIELAVPDPEDRPTFLMEKRVASSVTRELSMLAAIELHDQLGLSAGEVCEVWADGELPRELRAQARDHAPELRSCLVAPLRSSRARWV